jgi:DNA-binding winged helix-turn-helix (wHTH) protein/Tfp pilus assembly protein PilF
LAWGPYRLDLRSRQLLRDGTDVPLAIRHFALLHLLVSRAGRTVTKDELIETIWPNQPITDNSLAQAVSQVRAALDARHPNRHIATDRGRGYRFVGHVTIEDERASDAELDALAAPHAALVDGRAMIETLDRREIERAIEVFERLVARDSRDARYRVGLANACVWRYEGTRAAAEPDAQALRRAVAHAAEARRLAPGYAEAWATYGFVMQRAGDDRRALASLRHATSIEADSWQHHLRLAYAGWGDERLGAARRALELWPNLLAAHLLVATVFVARGSLGLAERELDIGLAVLLSASASAAFSAVALHWLKGLLCLARGDMDEAIVCFDRELALEPRGHLYGRECCASAWYAKGACYARRGDEVAARVAFEEAISRVPGFPLALAGLAMFDDRTGEAVVPVPAGAIDQGETGSTMPIDRAMGLAARLAGRGDVAGAAALVARALESAPSGNAGWLLPVDPLLDVQRHPAAWTPALAILSSRATLRPLHHTAAADTTS